MHPSYFPTQQRLEPSGSNCRSSEEKPSDGEIYCKLRQCQRERNWSSERRWLARLSSHKATVVNQLFQRKELSAAFDDLLCIPGLWDGMRISTLHKMFRMRCDEVGKIFQRIFTINHIPGNFMLSEAYQSSMG